MTSNTIYKLLMNIWRKAALWKSFHNFFKKNLLESKLPELAAMEVDFEIFESVEESNDMIDHSAE